MTRVVPLLALLLFAGPAMAEVDCNEGMEPLVPRASSPISAVDFVREVAVKEGDFARAFAALGYTAEVVVQTLQGDAVDGEFRQTTVFDGDGTRRDSVPDGFTSTLTRLKLSDKDIDGLIDELPFALTADSLADRDVVYAGRQKMGPYDTSVFDMLARESRNPGDPRTMTRRGFVGRVWVATDEDAVLRTCGRNAAFPIGPMRYEVLRDKVAGDYWLPARLRADGRITVGSEPVQVRITVTYSDYKGKP